MITIKIRTGNQAFQDGHHEQEVARILHKIAEDFEQENVKDTYNDINGNKVCTVIEER